MKPSDEFKKFGLQFIQDIELMGDFFEELIRNILIPFKGEERVRLRSFLDKLLDDGLSDAELQQLWNATPSDIFFRDAEGHENRPEGGTGPAPTPESRLSRRGTHTSVRIRSAMG